MILESTVILILIQIIIQTILTFSCKNSSKQTGFFILILVFIIIIIHTYFTSSARRVHYWLQLHAKSQREEFIDTGFISAWPLTRLIYSMTRLYNIYLLSDDRSQMIAGPSHWRSFSGKGLICKIDSWDWFVRFERLNYKLLFCCIFWLIWPGTGMSDLLFSMISKIYLPINYNRLWAHCAVMTWSFCKVRGFICKLVNLFSLQPTNIWKFRLIWSGDQDLNFLDNQTMLTSLQRIALICWVPPPSADIKTF